MNLSPALDTSVVAYLRGIPWILVAPLLVVLSARLGQKALAWGAPVAALWAIWCCATPAFWLPLRLGGIAGWTMAPVAAVAAVVYVGASLRAAQEAPAAGVQTRHALHLTMFALAIIGVGAIAATFRLASAAGAG